MNRALQRFPKVPRVVNGVDHGVSGYWISSSAKGNIVWFPGHTTHVYRGVKKEYVPSRLVFFPVRAKHDMDHLEIVKGGQFKSALRADAFYSFLQTLDGTAFMSDSDSAWVAMKEKQ